ncbi:uncharacterized protein LOC128870325 [Anastrepha ludens]|uniref:uncharacterized protein LOC128870325 n=1 Tax=Anastrepha ludens TaxID=28586 RepID=UPI0023B0CDFE|nr:uncharacterized protein LOC128870325 [Anastrepha ludens]
MLNARGPKQPRRQLLADVVKNMASQHPSFFRGIKAAYRLCALRVCSAFKTVSEEAALVIVGMYPIEILANEAAVLADSEMQRIVARETSTQTLQQIWNNTTKGRWTDRCIPDLRSRIERKHGEVDFYLTQFLTPPSIQT